MLVYFVGLAFFVGSAFAQVGPDPSTWYKKYPLYPNYCSTPEQMVNREVPPLSVDSRTGATQIVHVSNIIRHGARAPTHDYKCWEGYQGSDAAVWNCHLLTVVAAPPPRMIHEEETSGMGGTTTNALFLKNYNALSNPEYGLHNEINGNCQAGQLILQGYDQQLRNGKMLRNAYIAGANERRDYSRLWLLNATETKIWNPENLYFRVDDKQRTIMSGQTLIRGMMGPEIQAFVASNGQSPYINMTLADRSQDIISRNENICPRLKDIRTEIEASKEFKEFMSSQEVKEVEKFETEVLGLTSKDHRSVSCLMTALCTDRPLPEALDDFDGEIDFDPNEPSKYPGSLPLENSTFARYFAYQEKLRSFRYVCLNATYSKLSAGPLMNEVMVGIMAFVNGESQVCCPSRPASKFSLYSAHDDTLMSLLPALGPKVWDEKWEVYAGSVLIELHKVNLDGMADQTYFPSYYAFRLIHNGKVITERIEGCQEGMDLCDILMLVDATKDWAVLERDCNVLNNAGGRRALRGAQ